MQPYSRKLSIVADNDYRTIISPLRKKYTMTKFHAALKSSRAAIDLASIMVGTIIIGLVGGVIAATVFAVIPWSQDNAAKQQLDSVASAESAYRGLSADTPSTLQNPISSPTSNTDANQVVLNSSFTGSDGLATNNLLSKSSTYCVTATTDGSDYNAYSKSGSGKVFTKSSKNQQVTQVKGTSTTPVNTCLGTVAADGTVTPPPTYTVTAVYDFDNPATLQGWSGPGVSWATAALDSTTTHSGANSVHVTTTTYGNVLSRNVTTVLGKSYHVEAWVYQKNKSVGATIATYKGTNTVSASTVGNWEKVSVDFTATGTAAAISMISAAGTDHADFYIDDITVSQLN